MQHAREGDRVEPLAPQVGERALDQRLGLRGDPAVGARLAGDDGAAAVDDAHQPGVLQLLVRLAHQHAADAQLVLDLADRGQQVPGSQFAERQCHLHLLLELHVGRNPRGRIVVERCALRRPSTECYEFVTLLLT